MGEVCRDDPGKVEEFLGGRTGRLRGCHSRTALGSRMSEARKTLPICVGRSSQGLVEGVGQCPGVTLGKPGRASS